MPPFRENRIPMIASTWLISPSTLCPPFFRISSFGTFATAFIELCRAPSPAAEAAFEATASTSGGGGFPVSAAFISLVRVIKSMGTVLFFFCAGAAGESALRFGAAATATGANLTALVIAASFFLLASAASAIASSLTVEGRFTRGAAAARVVTLGNWRTGVRFLLDGFGTDRAEADFAAGVALVAFGAGDGGRAEVAAGAAVGAATLGFGAVASALAAFGASAGFFGLRAASNASITSLQLVRWSDGSHVFCDSL
mmetsp:Transcript_846/g.1401  ORF Transcript_846/g.1401 Transcript_846/m.1401 type:complete len:256 (-) Transcript_846:142-909(-)